MKMQKSIRIQNQKEKCFCKNVILAGTKKKNENAKISLFFRTKKKNAFAKIEIYGKKNKKPLKLLVN